jgi:type III pantothenate kinase
MQSGAYYGQLGTVREILQRLTAENFGASERPPLCIGTGGFAAMFEREDVFDRIIPDLVLRGVLLATALNAPTAAP